MLNSIFPGSKEADNPIVPEQKPSPCDSVFFQKETVCVPVTVKPFAHPGDATTTCCGEPEIDTKSSCSGSKTTCTFTVTQKLCIEVPITFGADVETGDAMVQCGEVSEKECKCDDPHEK